MRISFCLPLQGLETSHYDVIFNALAVRNTAKYSKAIFPPSKGAKHDYEIFRALTDKMNTARGKNSLKLKLINSYLTPKRKVDLGLKLGPYGKWKNMGKLFSGLSLRKLKNNPHGIDLGPLRSQLPKRLFTKDQKIALAQEVIMEDVKRVLSDYHALANKTVNGELYLIGRRSLRTNNSWMHNSERLVKNNLCTLLMHPDDAVQHKVRDKDTVTVESKVGKVSIPVEVTEDVMQGVVCIPHGWGHNRKNTRMQVANLHAGVSINDLTDDSQIDELTGNAVLNGVPVKVYV